MTQKAGTYEVVDGFLMSGNECVSISRCRVIIEPLSQPPAPTIRIQVTERKKGRWERTADRLGKGFVLGFALYLVIEVAHAFSSGAVARLVQQ